MTDDIRYSLTEGDSSMFNVDRETGRVSTRVELNYEEESSYVLVVSTRDGEDAVEEGDEDPRYSTSVYITVQVSHITSVKNN